MNIKIYNKIAEQGLDILRQNGFDLLEGDTTEQPAQGMVLRSKPLTKDDFDENLLGVARAGSGVNNIPVDQATEEGIIVFNTPRANANAVNELVIGALIGYSRHLIEANQWTEELTGDDINKQVEQGKKTFKGSEIRGKTLGVIGLGSIGHLVANAANELGMKVVGYDPFMTKDAKDKLDQHLTVVDNRADLYQVADFVTIHVPAMDSNYHLVDEDAVNLMKDDAVLLNFARGDLADSDAIIKALDADKLAGYLTDFPNTDLIAHPKVTVYPHLGASTFEAEKICAEMAANQLTDFLKTGNIVNAVNFPETTMPLTDNPRFAIINRNVPNMINAFVDEISKHQLNISSFVNKSQGEYAYTLIDVENHVRDKQVFDDVLQALEEKENVLRIRLIRKED